MRAVVAAVLRNHLAERDQLAGVGVHAGCVGQAAAHPDRALGQALGAGGCASARARPAVGRRGPRRRPPAAAGCPAAPGRPALQAMPCVEAVEIARDGVPGEVEVARARRSSRRSARRSRVRVASSTGAKDRPSCPSTSVVTPWLTLAVWSGFGQDLQVGVRVHVDEARTQDLPFGVDLTSGRGRSSPMAAIRSPSTATSATEPSAPEPSRTVALRNTMSAVIVGAALRSRSGRGRRPAGRPRRRHR